MPAATFWACWARADAGFSSPTTVLAGVTVKDFVVSALVSFSNPTVFLVAPSGSLGMDVDDSRSSFSGTVESAFLTLARF